jgi:hypothetical protein
VKASTIGIRTLADYSVGLKGLQHTRELQDDRIGHSSNDL